MISHRPNQQIALQSQPGVLYLGDEAYATEVFASIRFRPYPRFVLTGGIGAAEHPLELLGAVIGDRTGRIALAGSGDSREVILRRFAAGDPCRFEAALRSGSLVAGAPRESASVCFHLVNFPDFIAQHDGRVWRNYLTFQDARFQIEIEAAPNHDEAFPELKSEGGFGITHWGRLSRHDGGRIGFALAGEVLHALHVFLSFCRGAWVGLLLPMGLDEHGEVAWAEWGDRLVTEWQSVGSWLDRHNGQAVATAYRGFSDLWWDDYWKKVLSKCIYWYLRSNGPGAGVDGGIVLTQAALEQMSWATLLDGWGSLSSAGFDRLYAADRLRLMLSRMQIPLAIPESLRGLAALGKELNWDGPAAFTEIRNELVHPARGGRLTGRDLPYHEAWNLGQWYLELAILSLLGFHDVYSDRTRLGGWVGEVTRPPWCQG